MSILDGRRLDPGDGRAVLVTGASSGLGRAAAIHLAARGFTVIAGTRSEADGASVVLECGRGPAQHVRIDVTDQDSITAAAARITELTGGAGLWGLVNNAGIAVSAPLECVPTELLRRQLETNVIGQLAVTRAMLPLLRTARGRIVNVTSGLGTVAIPYMGPYSTAQFAKEGMSAALRRELAPHGVSVSVVAPGAIMTPIWDKISEEANRVLEAAPPAVADLYRETFRNFVAGNEEGARTSGVTPEHVAAAIGHAIGARKPRIRYKIGADVVRGTLLARVLPEAVIDRMFHPIVAGAGAGAGAGAAPKETSGVR